MLLNQPFSMQTHPTPLVLEIIGRISSHRLHTDPNRIVSTICSKTTTTRHRDANTTQHTWWWWWWWWWFCRFLTEHGCLSSPPTTAPNSGHVPVDMAPKKNRHRGLTTVRHPASTAHTSWCEPSRPSASERAQSAKMRNCARPTTPSSSSRISWHSISSTVRCECVPEARSQRSAICSTVRC